MTHAGPPQEPIEIPPPVRQLAGGAAVQPVWRNELGGITFRVGTDPVRFCKWQEYAQLTAQRRREVSLTAEAQRLRWAARYHRVPRLLDHGTSDDAEWLVTEALPGTSAVDPLWLARPQQAVEAIAVGMRQAHDALPAADCPFTGTWTLGVSAPGASDPVVVHGDPCVPNTLLDAAGNFAGHVDLGQLGVADRWADLAIASYSLSWPFNFGPGYAELFFASYGIESDWDRISFYRRLWDCA